MIVVSDTSPITNLSAIGQLDLLQGLYTCVIIPVAVYNEMVSVNKVVPGAIEVQTLPWIETQTVTDLHQVTTVQESQNNIDLGEAEAITLALELKADLLLIDERRGRIVSCCASKLRTFVLEKVTGDRLQVTGITSLNAEQLSNKLWFTGNWIIGSISTSQTKICLTIKQYQPSITVFNTDLD